MSGFSDAPDESQPLVISATIGTDPTIPTHIREAHLRESVQRVLGEQRRIADALLGSLMVSGIDQCIQFADIERLASYGKTPKGRDPAFMRKIVVELMLCLRPDK